MLNVYQIILLAVVQGVTELFPISSLGHDVILPKLLGWNINQNDPFFLNFLVAIHLATALVLFFYFFPTWKKIITSIFQKNETTPLAHSLIIATIPAGILGLVFENKLKSLFASPQIVAIILIFNGLLLFLGEVLRKRIKSENLKKINWLSSLKIGLMQCLALIPGFSRTGSTIVGGLLSGLSHEEAANFSFLLATPIIAAAAVLKLPHLIKEGNANLLSALLGGVVAGIAAYLSVRFLTKYFKKETLLPFAIYCLAAGILSLLFIH